MTWTVKHRGDTSRPTTAVYTCPEHGEFDATVERDENGEAPDVIGCRELEYGVGGDMDCGECGRPSTWTPTPIACSVRRVEVVRGKYEKPERKTFLDTRKLGEGQDIEEFRAERAKVWDEKRQRDVKELIGR
jgi:hypothetical protein